MLDLAVIYGQNTQIIAIQNFQSNNMALSFLAKLCIVYHIQTEFNFLLNVQHLIHYHWIQVLLLATLMTLA